MPQRTTDGDLLRQLTGDEHNAYKAPRGSTPREGTTVRLWRLGGAWSVWSQGPVVGTWWLQAADDDARAVADAIAAAPHRAHPVVVGSWRQSIAVRGRDIQ